LVGPEVYTLEDFENPVNDGIWSPSLAYTNAHYLVQQEYFADDVSKNGAVLK